MAILRKSLYLLPAALLLPLFTSCYEDFDPGIKTTPKVCLNALLTADSTFKVSLLHARPEGRRNCNHTRHSPTIRRGGSYRHHTTTGGNRKREAAPTQSI